MNSTHAFSEVDEFSRRLKRKDIAIDHYQGVVLAPTTLESLVTWDVSAHAQRELDRLSSAYRNQGAKQGGY
jgi:hypothetical protein